MNSKASFCGTEDTRSAENRSRLNPAGGSARPGPNLPLRISFHTDKTKPNLKPDISLLFKPDILTCYEHRYRVAARTSNTPDSATTNIGFRCLRDV